MSGTTHVVMHFFACSLVGTTTCYLSSLIKSLIQSWRKQEQCANTVGVGGPAWCETKSERREGTDTTQGTAGSL